MNRLLFTFILLFTAENLLLIIMNMNRLMLCILVFMPAFNLTAQVLDIDNNIQLIHLRDSVFMHVTWDEDESYGRFSSNGLILIRSGKALMIDTPSDNEKTEKLVRYLKECLSVQVEKVIVGHFHDDCLGGLGYFHDSGVSSLGNRLTVDKCRELNLPMPSEFFTSSYVSDFHDEVYECWYFGPGHSVDNIVVWFPELKILFGGCLIKSLQSTGLGNLSDAVTGEWDATVNKLMDNCRGIDIVIPGHGEAGNSELLRHTIRLVKTYNNK